MPRYDRSFPSAPRTRQTLASPLFVACALVIAAAAIGLRPATTALGDRYRKETIALRRPLNQFTAACLPSFRKAKRADSQRSRRDPEREDFVWVYVREEGRYRPPRRADLLLTYYSDPGDKVPHTPEVCYRQSGVEVTDISTVTVETPGLAPEHPQITARLLHLKQPVGQSVVLYVFCVNGEFCYDRERVRWIIARPGDRYIYFGKVEAVADCPSGPNTHAAVERCKKLLREALPVLVNEYYPDTAQLKRRP